VIETSAYSVIVSAWVVVVKDTVVVVGEIGYKGDVGAPDSVGVEVKR